MKDRQFAQAASINALSSQTAQLVLGDVQPTAVFRCETEVDAANVLPRSFRLEGFVERADRVRIQVVANQPDAITLRVSSVEPSSTMMTSSGR